MRLVAVVLLLLPATLGCGGGAATGPPDIAYGRDVCAECHMIISEARYAAAYRDGQGEPFVFDDIGDMVAHAARAGVLDDMTAWVHDYDTEEWIDAPAAWYVQSSVETPMGHGVVAFAGEPAARAFAQQHDGSVVVWEDLSGAGASGHPDHASATTEQGAE